MKALRIAAVAACVLTTSAIRAQSPARDQVPPSESDKPERFSPLGFLDLLAYEQAYPGLPGSAAVIQASTARYWAFRGVALRGSGQPEGAVWQTLGPETSLNSGSTDESRSVSGRVSALAISPLCDRRRGCRMWVGTAGGGVWRSDDALNTSDARWRWIGAGLGTNSIGSLTVDPNDRNGNTIFVGTGETNTPNNSGAGTGLYRSADGGDRWSRVSTLVVDPAVAPGTIDFTTTRGISTVVVEPGNPQTIYVATTTAMLGMTAVRGGQSQTTGFPQPRVGLYKTENGGVTWTLVWVPPLPPVIPANPNLGVGVGDTMSGVRLVKLDPRNPKIVYATAFNNAIHRSAPSLEGGDASFKPIYAIAGFQRFQDLGMFDVTVLKDNRTRLYVYNGTASLDDQGLYRLDNANVPAARLVTSDAAGRLTNTSAWIALTSNDTSQPGSTSRRLCSTQCFYDLVVAVPEGEPDTVILGGVATPTFGQPTIRSTNAGVSFSAFGIDARGSGSHVDVRAVVFHPREPRIAWVGSDGGVVRNDGNFEDITSRCAPDFNNAAQCQTVLRSVPSQLYLLNKGLQTLQFYNIALDPRAPLRRLIGGLQDNSTIWQDGTGDPRVWKSLFPFGDGTSASGFHPSQSNILFASFQSNRFFTNFRSGDLSRWVRTDDPIRASNERATVTASTGRQFITFDLVNPNTQFTGFQHIWRTQNNGGNQATLEGSGCTSFGGSSGCGDWVPLGVAFPFLPQTTPDSTSRKPGDLTSDFYGTDRAGGIIVAAARTPADAGTLWAVTNLGRLFVTKNADRPGADVDFVRIDTPSNPGRFITRIVVDRVNPNVALIAYSGFNTLTPATPGHIFRAVYDPARRAATFSSVDFDLIDIPINTIAFDDLRGDLYAATDFGPLLLRQGSTTWEIAGIGFPEALMVDLQIVPEQRVLVAATHGLGIFFLNLPPVGP